MQYTEYPTRFMLYAGGLTRHETALVPQLNEYMPDYLWCRNPDSDKKRLVYVVDSATMYGYLPLLQWFFSIAIPFHYWKSVSMTSAYFGQTTILDWLYCYNILHKGASCAAAAVGGKNTTFKHLIGLGCKVTWKAFEAMSDRENMCLITYVALKGLYEPDHMEITNPAFSPYVRARLSALFPAAGMAAGANADLPE